MKQYASDLLSNPKDKNDLGQDFYDYYCPTQSQLNVKLLEIPQIILPHINPDVYRNVMILFYLHTKQVEKLCKEDTKEKDKNIESLKLYLCTKSIADNLMKQNQDRDFCWSDIENSKYNRNQNSECDELAKVLSMLRNTVNVECNRKVSDLDQGVDHTLTYAVNELIQSINKKELCTNIVF